MKKNTTILAAMLMVINITKAQWAELGGSTHPLKANEVIFAITTDISGNVYAAGEFTDSSVHNYVAKWAGDSVWVKLDPTGLNAAGYIYTLATDDSGNVYAAGAFIDHGDSVYVAKWNGTAWTVVGGIGVHATGQGSDAIFSISVDRSGNVYAAGEFKDANSDYYVAKWNGSNWSELGTGSNALNANHFINCIAVDQSGNVYAAGDFTDSNGMQYVAQWNGANWIELGTGPNALITHSPIRTITTDLSGNVYVGYEDTFTNFYVAQWNGTSWDQVGSGSNALNANNSINSLTTDIAGNLYAAGNFTDANVGQYVAMWNGTNWTELGTGNNSLNPNGYILTIATDTALNVYAAGYFTDQFSKYYVAEYDPNSQTPAGINGVKSSDINAMNIAPNPSSGLTNITISAMTNSEISVSIYDMAGRLVANLYNGRQQTRQTNITFDTENIAAGIYTVKATDGSTSIVKRLVKIQ